MGTQTYVNNTTQSDAAEFNRFDTAAYAVLSGVAGTNTITATGPANYTYSATMPPVTFIPAVTNTGATTINITPSGGAAGGAKNVFWNGAACSGGELVAGVPVSIIYDGTRFQILGPSIGTTITASLGGDVALNNTANYFDGASIAQGTVGTWLVFAIVTAYDTAGVAVMRAKIYDGTTTVASGEFTTGGASFRGSITLFGIITSPAGNLRIALKDASSTSGVMSYNDTALGKDTTITAVRIA